MADYDIDKVSPRPWRYTGNYDADWIADANGKMLDPHCLDTRLHIVHCVNENDRLQSLASLVQGLVEALRHTIEGTVGHKYETRCFCAACEDARKALAEARRAMEEQP